MQYAQTLENILRYTVNIHVGVVPRLDNKVHSMRDNNFAQVASCFVQNQILSRNRGEFETGENRVFYIQNDPCSGRNVLDQTRRYERLGTFDGLLERGIIQLWGC